MLAPPPLAPPPSPPLPAALQTDINDKPPNPHQPPPEPRLKPRPKPWERAAGGGGGGPASSDTVAFGSPELSAGAPAAAAEAPAATPASAAPTVATLPALAVPPSPRPVLPSSPPQAVPSVGTPPFSGPARANSIYEAVSSPPILNSPGVIAGRLSPSRLEAGESRRSAALLCLFDWLHRLALPHSRGSLRPAEFSASGREPWSNGGAPDAAPQVPFSEPAAAAAAPGEAAANGGGALRASSADGSGIGRPSSRNWRPPPLPQYSRSSLEDAGEPSPSA